MKSSRPDSGAAALVARALDPARSVVVEACAGSGKTWLLASRIVRLLLSGVPPGAILAITFTRRAAGEIATRVFDWLRVLATAPEGEVVAFLEARAVRADAENVARARRLFEQVATARPGLGVYTFHGWFLQLAAVAPLSANLAGTALEETATQRFEELWQGFAAKLQAADGAVHPAARDACLRLLQRAGLSGVRRLIQRGLARRSEWLAYWTAHSQAFQEEAGYDSSAPEEQESAALAAFFVSGWTAEFRAYLEFLTANGTAGDIALADRLAAALEEKNAENGDRQKARQEQCLQVLASVLLTKDGNPRARKASKALELRLSAANLEMARFLDLHERLSARVIECLEARREEEIQAFNRDVLILYRAFLDHLEAFKNERRLIDFIDSEWRILQLLRDEENAAFMQARLDARYRHVLLDEFQDTNPLQWQILLAWLDAYGETERPTVFLVGDPKQSLYRFRRADPRLFTAAADFLRMRFDAVLLEQTATRRNAPKIVALVNELFSREPGFAPFPQQSSLAADLPGRIELLPLCVGEDEAEPVAAAESPEERGISTEIPAQIPVILRDPLLTPEEERRDRRRESEAALLAGRIAALVGRCRIRDAEGPGGGERPLRYGDILILARRRTQLRFYEQALIAAGIPFAAASRGGLLATQEAQDIVALLEFLVTPQADLSLAQTLKSPLFACSDDDLLRLARRDGAGAENWWPRLQALARETGMQADGIGTDSSRFFPLLRAERLLGGWIEDARRLPAHDLLDRIYHQGDVLERYRRAAPPLLADAVCANLRALLLFALDLDAGRYPSLPRFIAALRRLARGDSDEAPDEGRVEREENAAILAKKAEEVAEDGDRVRIMTIHGAKGLEAPLVWLLDANTAPRSDEAWDVLVDWPPGANAPTHFSFVGRTGERGRNRREIFAAEAEAAAREELNLLYVAMTRARQIFIASGIAASRNSDRETPYTRLHAALERLGAQEETLPLCSPGSPGSLYSAPGDEAAKPALTENALVFCDFLPSQSVPAFAAAQKSPAEEVVSRKRNVAETGGTAKTTNAAVASGTVSSAASPSDVRPLPALSVGSRRSVSSAPNSSAPSDPAARFGIVLHAMLERRAESGEGKNAVRIDAKPADISNDENWRRRQGISADEYRRVLPIAGRLLAAAHLARFFDPGQYRRAWNEVELCDENGALRRIDRLVEFEEGLWVLDYKSGSADAFPPQYRQQVVSYCCAVRAVFSGRPVRGALLFADATLLEVE